MGLKLWRRGQHADRLAIETAPVPPDETRPLTRVTSGLLQDPPGTGPPFAQTDVTTLLHALPAPPQRRALPAPLHDPASVPPLQPTPPPPLPRRPRQGWTPPPPPSAPPPPRITEPALLACPGGRIPPELTLPCGTCHRVHLRGATSSFRALYAAAAQDGWRRDLYGTWTCPACQGQPGWHAPHAPVLVWSEHELIRDVASRKAARWRWRKALRTARVHLDAKKLRALKA